MSDDFVHLHNHDEFSMLDGAGAQGAFIERAAELGQRALATTNHGNLHGAYTFRKAAMAADIKPIIGCELYAAPGERANTERDREDGFSKQGAYSHVTVLAKNSTGLRNLYSLSSEGYSEGFYSAPRTDRASLGRLRDGLIISTGCLSGELATRIRLEQRGLADAYLDWGKQTFGVDNFYVEVMNHEFDEETAVLTELYGYATRHGLKTIATGDAHYVYRDDTQLHDAMLCLQTQSRLTDEKRMRFSGHGYYLTSRSEIQDLFPKDALDNTLLVAEMISDYGDMLDYKLRMPTTTYADPVQALLDRCVWIIERGPEYEARLTYELDTIREMNFSEYFLVISDVLAVARERGIPVGPGRGSAGGSLVSYAARITGMDPVALGCSFERFLNKDRVSLPDIDIDIPDDYREAVIQIAREMYGDDRAARIGTIGRIKSKAALKDASRVLGYPYDVGEQLTYCLPPPKAGRSPLLRELDAGSAETRLAALSYDDPVHHLNKILALASKLEGLARSAGQHASGTVISPVPILDVCPTWNKRVGGKPGPAVTQWDMHAIEALGLVKLDFLGLNTMGTIDATLRALSSRSDYSGPRNALDLVYDEVHTRDAATYDMLSRGESVGVFQLDGRGMQTLLRRLAPKSIDDIAAVLALYRPGPMGVNAHWDYADRKNYRQRVQFPHPDFAGRLASILGPTYGLIVYQEQVTASLVEICGYTTTEADNVRRAMGKKDHDKLALEKPRVLASEGFSQESLEVLWDTLIPFADYAFNKSHALGYAFVSYWTAWLKANHPLEYFAALLTKEDDNDKVEEYMREVRRLGIAILPPDINTSGVEWTATQDGIRYGLGTIKGVGVSAIKSINKLRPFRDWPDLMRRGSGYIHNKNVVEALCKAGALDSLGEREAIWAVYMDHLSEAKVEREEATRGELGFRRREYTLPTKRTDYRWRKAREKEVLGLSLSEKPTVVHLPSDLTDADWEYVAEATRRHTGNSSLKIAVGSWQMDYGQVDSAALVRTLTPLGGKEI